MTPEEIYTAVYRDGMKQKDVAAKAGVTPTRVIHISRSYRLAMNRKAMEYRKQNESKNQGSCS